MAPAKIMCVDLILCYLSMNINSSPLRQMQERSNNRAEFLSLLSLLRFANNQNVKLTTVMGDSLLLIKQMKKEA